MTLKTNKQATTRFSIVIPAYNEADYIKGTIKSLKNQSFKGSYEIMVVDNNSTDNTYQVAKQAGVKVFREKNIGVCWARQKGVDESMGEIVVQADADTIYKSNWLNKIDEKFNNNPNLVAVVGPCIFNDAPAWGRFYPKLQFGLVNFVFKTFKRTIHASATNIAFKKSAFNRYDTNLTQGGDELYVLGELRKKGCIFFDNRNPSYTSSRRLTRGFFYNFFITFLIYYIIEYNLSRIFGRPILGMYPTFRKDLKPKKLLFIRVGVLCLVFFIIFIGVVKTRYIVLASPIRFNIINNIFR